MPLGCQFVIRYRPKETGDGAGDYGQGGFRVQRGQVFLIGVARAKGKLQRGCEEIPSPLAAPAGGRYCLTGVPGICLVSTHLSEKAI